MSVQKHPGKVSIKSAVGRTVQWSLVSSPLAVIADTSYSIRVALALRNLLGTA